MRCGIKKLLDCVCARVHAPIRRIMTLARSGWDRIFKSQALRSEALDGTFFLFSEIYLMEHNLGFTRYVRRITGGVMDRSLICHRCHQTCDSSLPSSSHRDGDRGCSISTYGLGSSQLPFARERMTSDNFRYKSASRRDILPSITPALGAVLSLSGCPPPLAP